MTGEKAPRSMVVEAVRHWADRGWLRRLDASLASFVAESCPSADATVVLAAALVANLEGHGHACLVVEALLADPAGLLGWEQEAIDALRYVLARLPADASVWIDALSTSDAVFVDAGGSAAGGGEPFVVSHGRFYLRRYWQHERRIADAVLARAGDERPVDVASARSIIERLFARRTKDRDTDWQKVATALASRGALTIVTGGPGTGKTFTAARIIALHLAMAADASHLRIALAAPTGKAAARLKQSIDAAFSDLEPRLDDLLPPGTLASRVGPARTLHRLLGTRPDSRRFRHDASHPLAVDLVVVDEASMIDVEMMAALLAALPRSARLVLLGDRDQLASVEAGAVLGELSGGAGLCYERPVADDLAAIAGESVPVGPGESAVAQRVVLLRRGERFAGAIDGLARAVNDGRVADADALLAASADGPVAWLATPDVVTLAVDGRPGAAGFGPFLDALAARPDSLFAEDHDAWVRRVLDAFERFRVLCAVRGGDSGVVAINRAIERRLADTGRIAVDGDWYAGRAVLVSRNDYDLGVFNGDVGVALRASPSDSRLRVHFADGPSAVRSVGVARLADVETAFAMTVHKAQGSEFAHTALVLPPEPSRVVTRELLYTGITRARESLTLVAATRDVLASAIAARTRRSSGIGAMLAAAPRLVRDV